MNKQEGNSSVQKISATIITFNEEEKIETCINSLAGIADEIIVVDSFSSDRTKEICEQLDVEFIQRTFEGHIQQKQYAISRAKYDFVLSLDADESLSDELRASIIEEKETMAFNAYRMNRRNYYCGRLIRHCGWYPDSKVRLFNKHKAYWGGENPHDIIIVQKREKVKWLTGDLIHITLNTPEELLHQTEKYARIAAAFKYKHRKHYRTVRLKKIINPLSKFFTVYFLKFGFLDGADGFTISYQEFIYTYRKYKYLQQYYKLEKLS